MPLFMKTKENPENKYLEQLFDLSDDADFMNALNTFRNKLGIPNSGFKTHEAETTFLSQNNLWSHTDPKSKSEIEKLKKELTEDPKRLEMILAWHELYNGNFLEKILDKFKIPRRASTHLYLFILFGKNKVIYEQADLLATGYGCQINCAFFWPNFKYDIKGFLYDKKDLASLIFIYPEATKADIKKAIDDNWGDIKISQLEIARKNNLPIPIIHAKTLRGKQDEIMKLHRKGLTSYAIAKKLRINQEEGFSYVRKVISRKKKLRNNEVMTKEEMSSEINKAKKTSRPPGYILVK
jgi:hypothetical protein